MGIPIFAGGRIVAEVVDDVLYKRVRGSKHFLRRPAAICFDVAGLAFAESVGAKMVEVVDTETGRRYRASIAAVKAHGFRLERGHGEQIGLLLCQWQVEDEGGPVQLRLWLVAA